MTAHIEQAGHGSVAVLGAGAAASALAASIGLRGHRVAVWSRPGTRLDALVAAGGIEMQLTNDVPTFVPVSRITTDLGAAVDDADVIVVAVNSDAQADLVASAARQLRDDHLVILVPGHTGAAWAARVALGRAHCARRPVLAEVPLPFVCRSSPPVRTRILQQKRELHVAALPGEAVGRTLAVLDSLGFPPATPVSLLEAGFRNMTAVFQPALMVCNAARIDAGVAFRLYADGATPAVGRLFKALDYERLDVARGFGFELPPAGEWLVRSYEARGDSLDEQIRNVPGYQEIAAPESLCHRFLLEHVPMSLVPMSELATVVGRTVPVADAMIELSSVLVGIDLRASGRNLRRLVPSGFPTEKRMAYFLGVGCA